MLTYGPGDARRARCSRDTPLPICLANVQPVPAVTAAWDMADLTYNQGIHGAQDTANAMVRAGRPFHVVTDDWHADSFARGGRRAGRARRPRSRAGARCKVAVFGYAMNGMGDIRVDVHALLRALGPQVDALAPGALHRAAQAVSDDDVRALMADEDARFEIDPRLSADEREDHARMQLGLEALLREGGYGAYSTHFDAIAEDGRFARLPLAAASSLMAKGYGYGAEGDALTAALMAAGRDAAGRHAVHRDVRDGLPQRLDPDEPHGRGQLGARARRPPGPAHQAPAGHRRPRRPADLPLPVRHRPGDAGHARRRSAASASGCWSPRARSSTPTSCRRSRCRTASSARTRGVRACMNAWLRLGGPHHQVLNPGRQAEAWRIFSELAGLEFAVA